MLTRMALAAAVFAAANSVALAQESSLANRSPGLTPPRGAMLQSKPVRRQARDISTPASNLMMNVMDRASSPFSCGG